MNEICYEVDFLQVEKHQSFMQVDSTVFGGYGQACWNSQSNCRILRGEISHKGLSGLPWFLLVFKDLHQSC